ncbi:hypothetical protein TSAR_010642 [Trichomalopsis sarcophagae]|uniref:tubulin-glutamate carboxypeptidase n=1 Tax=Trichomalopsis sarcophagae TaxID=543379 RepID=A0A232FA33_9HYME|nr:hypothetical protein TSAR_010642 [Trichomalopsis sarcophagae]
MEENIECGGFTFLNNFDSANLAKVEAVEINKTDNGKGENNKTYKSSSSIELPSYEFNIWTKHDCHGTEYQNNNKTWFHFGIKAAAQGVYVKLNLVNLNKQVKMFSQGMCPVFKVIPGHPQWERIREKPTFTADDKNNEFILSFNYRTSENPNAVTYFAFTYPFSYTDLQNHLKKIDAKMTKQNVNLADDIYYHRENAINSLEGRRLDILTISSYYNILTEREAKLKDLFPDENEERPFKFQDKKIIFISARVHPGETPSSFVLNGFLNLLLNREDQIAIALRRLYVFKLIPMLNPDGVAQGYYRMDTRGVNLNRLYLNPSKTDHPTIFAAKTLLRYYHNSYSLADDHVPEITNIHNISNFDTTSSIDTISNETNKLLQRVTLMSLEEKNKVIEQGSRVRNCLVQASEKSICKFRLSKQCTVIKLTRALSIIGRLLLTVKSQGYIENQPQSIESVENVPCKRLCSASNIKQSPRSSSEDSGIFLYIDFHGHASKKGIFMYGNHFDDPEDSSACMLLPKLMSINNPNFHFTSCNFAEKNMYLVDKRDGMSREGSGRVAVYKLTGLVHSYTLECNYNTGRLVNTVPARVKEGLHKIRGQLFIPPKYNPAIFEEVGAALGPSILDMTGNNPNSRLPNSQYRSLKGLKSYLKLISTNHYQTSLNKPLHKHNMQKPNGLPYTFLNKITLYDNVLIAGKTVNSGGDQCRYSQDSTPDESKFIGNFVMKSSSIYTTKFSNNTYKLFRTANIYGTIKKKMKNRISRQASLTKNSNKGKNRDSKIRAVSKIVTAHIQPKSKSTISSHNEKLMSKPNFSTKKQSSNREKSSKIKLPSVKNSAKKSAIYAKKIIGSKKSQGAHKSISRNAAKALINNKQKNKNNNSVSKSKGKKEISKSNRKSRKKSSSTRI